MLISCDIFSPAATIVCTQSAERKQSGYCGPLGWPAPILRAPTPPTMTTRGIDMHCRCICASAILWSPQAVPRSSLIYPCSYMWWQKMISCLISLFVKESSQLWSCVDEQYLYTTAFVLHSMLRHRAFCVADVSCMYTGCWVKCWPAPYCFFVDVFVYVPMHIIPTAICWSMVCVITSVVLFFTCYWQLLFSRPYSGISDALLWAAQ